MSATVYHVELRQFPNVARAFNLSREQLEAQFVQPWRAGHAIEYDERRWDPGKARLSIYEGRPLEAAEIGMGRGWANATRTGSDVTAETLAEPSAVERFKAELPARVTLSELVSLAGSRYPGARASERLALAEQAVWELLHEGAAQLRRAGRPLPREQWSAVVLSWEAWSDSELELELELERP